MASPGAVSAEPPGEEDIDGEIPREQARIGISTGTDLLVSFNGTSTELKIQFDKQGKIRIFGDEIGPQLPKTVSDQKLPAASTNPILFEIVRATKRLRPHSGAAPPGQEV